MTAVDPEIRTLPQPGGDDPTAGRALTLICPYLAAAGGAWRGATAERDHRCGAVAPPAPLAAEKQRRLCLTADYPSCATFEAARATRPVAHARPPTLPRPIARTTPLVLDHARVTVAVPALRADRSNAQAVLIVLMALAFAAIVLARLTGASAPAAVSGTSPSPPSAAGAVAAPSLAAVASKTPVPATSSPASVAPTTRPAGSAAPATPRPTAAVATRTYKVKPGDTLIAIAAKFGTKLQDIKRLNGIADPSSLRIGQVLKIP
jgi:LysM repeat protein